MINLIIRFIKKNPFLYNLAKRVNRFLKRNNDATKRVVEINYYGFIIKTLEELKIAKQKYAVLKKYNTKLLILIDNPSYNIIMHRLIRENPDICFASFDYFRRYRAKFAYNKIIWLNFTDDNLELLDYLN